MMLLLIILQDPMKEHQIYKMYEDLYDEQILSYMEVAEPVVIVRGHKLTNQYMILYRVHIGASPYPVNNFSRA
jgi:hypothetical protein